MRRAIHDRKHQSIDHVHGSLGTASLHSNSQRFVIVLLALSAVLLSEMSLFAQPSTAGKSGVQGKQWAILIGVENYQHANPLSFTVNDVDQLAITLRERGGVSNRNIVKFVDNAPDEKFQPLRSNLMEELPGWFKKPRKDQRFH